MAKKKKKLSKTQRAKRRDEQEAKDLDDLAAETAGIYTCSEQVVADFAFECGKLQERIEVDLLYDSLAHDFWNGRAGVGTEIASALAAYIRERQRHRKALGDFRTRFAALGTDNEDHEHLDPFEHYVERVRARLVMDDPQTVTDMPI